jgi:peroxin-19
MTVKRLNPDDDILNKLLRDFNIPETFDQADVGAEERASWEADNKEWMDSLTKSLMDDPSILDVNSTTKHKLSDNPLDTTMNRLRQSSAQVKSELDTQSSAGNSSNENDMLEALMKQLGDGADGGGLDNVLASLMGQLVSKDVLYEPLQDLTKKYPEWLSTNRNKIDKGLYEKYELQYSYCKQIVACFDKDADAPVADLLQKMQECGAPPADMLQELAPDMKLGEDGLPELPNDIMGALSGMNGNSDQCTIS